MQVKLSPLWNVFNKNAWGMLIGAVLIFCLISVAAIYTGEWSALVFVAVVLLIGESISLFVYFPHFFELWEGRLQYTRAFSLRKRFGGKGRKQVRTTLTVPCIESVELKQNALEKLFNTGRVIITGYAEVEFLRDYSDFYTEQVSAPYHHAFYGVRQFDKFRNEIYDHIDPAMLTINVNH